MSATISCERCKGSGHIASPSLLSGHEACPDCDANGYQVVELSPCPFCGKEPEYLCEDDHHGDFFRLGCSDEECAAHWLYYTEPQENSDECIRRWNTRVHLPDQPQAASMREALSEAHRALVAFKDAVIASDHMKGREYVGLGIQVNDAIDKARLALSSEAPR